MTTNTTITKIPGCTSLEEFYETQGAEQLIGAEQHASRELQVWRMRGGTYAIRLEADDGSGVAYRTNTLAEVLSRIEEPVAVYWCCEEAGIMTDEEVCVVNVHIVERDCGVAVESCWVCTRPVAAPFRRRADRADGKIIDGCVCSAHHGHLAGADLEWHVRPGAREMRRRALASHLSLGPARSRHSLNLKPGDRVVCEYRKSVKGSPHVGTVVAVERSNVPGRTEPRALVDWDFGATYWDTKLSLA